jgi:hypothetical protein
VGKCLADFFYPGFFTGIVARLVFVHVDETGGAHRVTPEYRAAGIAYPVFFGLVV